MKRIRWKGELQWDDGEGTPLRSDTSEIFYTDYAGSEWAEITEAIYDSVPGRILLEVKEPEKPVSLVDAVKRHLGTLLTVFREEPLRLPHLKELVEAMDREEAKKPKYTDEVVDEFLDAAAIRLGNGTSFDLCWFYQARSKLGEEGSCRLWDAYAALIQQRVEKK